MPNNANAGRIMPTLVDFRLGIYGLTSRQPHALQWVGETLSNETLNSETLNECGSSQYHI
jgi:hypothetical protein